MNWQLIGSSWLLSLLVALPAAAQPRTEISVSQEAAFTDVSRDGWAYRALLQMVNQYGCIVGYPDGTYRGNQPLTRYEFAAGLNACLEVILALQQAQTTADSQQLEELRESMEIFQQDLNELGGDLSE